MPDHDFRGKRLHLVRLTAAGMGCHIPATKEAHDEAAQLVDKVLALAPTPPPRIHPALAFGCGLAGALVLAVIVGAFIAVAVIR